MTFIGAKIWCNGCKSEGVIGWQGPHRNATMMGKQQALDGDICLCKCTPSPVMLASQDSASHSFEADQLHAMGFDAFGRSMTNEHRGAFDERVRVLDDKGQPISGVPYHISSANGAVYKGTTDVSGFCPRVYSDGVSRLDIAIGIRALERWSSPL